MNKKLVAGIALGASVALTFGGQIALAEPETTAADTRIYSEYGKGLDYSQVETNDGPKMQAAFNAPASASLMEYALTPGNQRNTNGCVTWATGYAGYGILMKEQGISGAPMAPMFIYSQIVKELNNGEDRGTFGRHALNMEQTRGIETQANYWQGTTDFRTLPTAAQKANALNYKLSSWTNLMNYSDLKGAIKDSISKGRPVSFGFRTRTSLQNTRDIYSPSGADEGGHEVLALAYDENYVTVQNSWGTSWAKGGFFRVPWSFFNAGGDVLEAFSMNGVRKDYTGKPDGGDNGNDTKPDDPKPEPGPSTLVNGNFEQGASGWSGDTKSINTDADYAAHGGSYKLWLLGYGRSTTEKVSQKVTVPSAGKLSFYMQIGTKETTKYTKYDTLNINVLDASGSLLGTAATFSNLNANSGYELRKVDLSKWAGKTITLEFAGKEDSMNATSFVIDDVTLS